MRRQDFQRTQQERQRKKSPSGRRFTKKLALYGRQLRGFRLCRSFSVPSPFAAVPPQRSLGFLTLVPVTQTLVGGRWVHDIGSCHHPFSVHLISFPWLMPTWHLHSGIWVGVNKCKTAMWQPHNSLFKGTLIVVWGSTHSSSYHITWVYKRDINEQSAYKIYIHNMVIIVPLAYKSFM